MKQKNLDKKIQISENYFFEFDKNLLEKFKNEESFLGWEYTVGKIHSALLEKFIPHCNVTFLPIMGSSLQENCILKNLPEEAEIFLPKNMQILVDWPEEGSEIITQIIKSFPSCVSLATHKTVDQNAYIESNDSLVNQIQNNPVVFIESLDSRRFLLNKLSKNTSSVHCIGGIETYLQWQILNKMSPYQNFNIPSELQLSGASLTWLQLKMYEVFSFDNDTHNFIHKKLEKAVYKTIQHIIAHNSKPILIICGIELFKKIENTLKIIKNKTEFNNIFSKKVVQIKKNQDKNNANNLLLCQPSKETASDYINLPSFFANDLLKLNEKITSWLDFARHSFAQAFIRTSDRYAEWTKFKINASQERDYFRFVYRLAKDRNMIFPNTFDLLLSASAVIDSNFAFEFLKECKDYPTNPNFVAALPVVDFPLNHFIKNTAKISIQKFETLQSKKTFKKAKLKSVDKIKKFYKPVPVNEDKYADNTWVNEDHPYSCSFPSEDIFMERLAANVKKNMNEKIRSQEIVFRELQADFCDGLDLRETIRNWHKEKIIIKDLLNVGKADIGAVVFSFADSQKDNLYSWKSFWLAEQHDDSNLMFYATPFKDNLIGPGIAKSEFGGFAVIPLPSAMENPWGNPFISHYAQNSTECLILAGALSTEHKSILFISNHPPSQHISKILKQSGKGIIYAKLDEFPPEDIRLVRTFHILAEAGVREYAQKYIRKD
ncbi:hypothetical protein [Fluviispira multicolorata]|uniref:Uncharacterized protein n=1 Tax=Fluviispira multicolorata TaxID=2654512 RepID=A0A833N2G1_9BACT|nr:hypothetical protein [Fluviispira multicolorata]KAB8032197.1 hypothetical protein GCL57_06000 [Fluviispira multicolorata]